MIFKTSIFTCSIAAVAMLSVALSKKIFKWKKDIDKNNVQLMKLYLELKFLYKNLAESANISCSTSFCLNLIDAMKEYYNLSEVVVIDSISIGLISNKMNLLKKNVFQVAKENCKQIQQELKIKNMYKKVFKFNKKDYMLYIFKIAQDIESESFIVCVENSPSLLTKNELIGLENNVNLLRTRMMLDSLVRHG